MAEDKKKNTPIGFSLKSFELIDYKPPKDEVDLQNLGFQIGFKTDEDLNEQTYSIDFEVVPKLGKKILLI